MDKRPGSLFLHSLTLTLALLATWPLALALAQPPATSQPAPADGGAAIKVGFRVPGKGLLSLGVYDPGGTLVRSLAYAQEVPAGDGAIAWDATGDLGRPVEPGTYNVRGVWFPCAPKVRFVMKVGVSGNPPYVDSNGMGGWGANLGAPAGLAGNGRYVAAAFGCVEDNLNTGVQLMDANGEIVRRFHTFFPWDVRYACAMDANNYYLALASLGAKRLVVAKYDLDNPRGKILADIPSEGTTLAAGRWIGRWTTDVRGMAAGGGRLYVSATLDNKLYVLDSADGQILQTVAIPSPRGLAVRGPDVFLLSGKQLLKLDADGRTVATVVATGLDDPSGLALDAQGNFYIADGGAAQQVKVFGPDGKPLRTIGVAGGRPRNGRFNPDGMLDPRSLCFGPDGRLWVAEDNEDFQRISVWDASGKLSQDFFNCRISADEGRLGPDESEMVLNYGIYADAPGLTAYKVDFAKGTWHPSWHLSMPLEAMQQEGVLLGNGHIFNQQAKAVGGHSPYLSYTEGLIRADNGRTYAFGGDFSIYLFDPNTCQTRLAALIYTHRAHKTQDGRFEGDYDQGPNNWLSWSDLDGDGVMSMDEVTFAENVEAMKAVSRAFAVYLQKDLGLLILCPDWTVRRLPARKVLDSGVPVYNWADVQTVVQLRKPDLAGGDSWKPVPRVYPQSLVPNGGDFLTFGEAATNVKLRLGGVDGDGWWASRNWRQTPLIYDAATGVPRWNKLGRRAAGVARPGEMYFPKPIAGRFDGLIFVPSTIPQMYVWTDTGLYVGKLYVESQEAGPDSDRIRVELVGAYVHKIDGKLYACTGDQGVFVHEILMPPLGAIDAGTVVVTPAAAAAAKPWDPDGPPPSAKPVYIARSIYDWKEKKPLRQITVDGKLDDAEWSGVQAMPIFMDGNKVADVKIVFDDQNLYLAYDVPGAGGLKNSGQELPYAPFTSGAYVDFCMGPQWDKPQRQIAAEGDVRVLVGPMGQSASYQMGYWPVRKDLKAYAWPAGKDPAKFVNPQVIASPAAQQAFDDISPVTGLQWVAAARDDGYTVEVKVPLDSLAKWLIQKHPEVGFDASVAFANPGGTERLRAAHWAGESEGRVVDRPGAAQLRPWTWGTLQFDRTPLPPAK